MFTSEAPHDQSKLILTCLATGFYPKHTEMKITLNEIELQPFSSTGVRPNDDHTFQLRTSVNINRDEKRSYECHVLHNGQILETKWGKYDHINSQTLILCAKLLYSSFLLQLAAQNWFYSIYLLHSFIECLEHYMFNYFFSLQMEVWNLDGIIVQQ